MIFAERLKELREESGLNQSQFAATLKYNQSKYNKWENGVNTPDYDSLCDLSKKLGVSTDYLLGLTAHKNMKEANQFNKTFSVFENVISKKKNGTNFLESLIQLAVISEKLAPFSQARKDDIDLFFDLFYFVLRDIVETLEAEQEYIESKPPHEFQEFAPKIDKVYSEAIESLHRIYRNIVVDAAFIALEEGNDAGQIVDMGYTLIRRTGLGRDWRLFKEYEQIDDEIDLGLNELFMRGKYQPEEK